MKRIGVDVGGTFTDLILVDEETGRIAVDKVASTPDDPSRAVVEGVEQLCAKAGVSLGEVDNLLHGTTVATNIVLTHSGAEVGMLTTEGFRDILHIARHKKPFNFSLQQELPWQSRPLVKRRHRLTVKERVTVPDGEVLIAARRGRGARARPRAPRGRRRRGRRLPPPLVPEPRARAADQGDRARGVPRRLPVRLARGAAPLPRVRAVLDRLPERVRRPEGLALRRAPRRGHAERRLRPRRPADAVLRRHGDRRVGDAAPRQPAHVRTGGRPDRRHLGGQGGRPRERRHPRHRRHVGRHRRGRERPAADAPPARHEGRRLPGDGADGRHRHDRRRRRLDRLRRRRRRLPRRPAVGGRGPRPGLLRPRRHRADVDRRAAPARAAPPGPRPARRRHAAGRRPRPDGDGSVWRTPSRCPSTRPRSARSRSRSSA